jgi:hypothetical protein
MGPVARDDDGSILPTQITGPPPLYPVSMFPNRGPSCQVLACIHAALPRAERNTQVCSACYPVRSESPNADCDCHSLELQQLPCTRLQSPALPEHDACMRQQSSRCC